VRPFYEAEALCSASEKGNRELGERERKKKKHGPQEKIKGRI
jgi:hypothetical protein